MSVNARAVFGTVRTTTGTPIQGVMVIGSDLNYAETDANGRFELKDPDCAVVFWCTGFKPCPQIVQRGVSDPLDVVLNAL